MSSHKTRPERKDTNMKLEEKPISDSDWVEAIISEQEEDLLEEDALLSKLPKTIAEQYRDDEF